VAADKPLRKAPAAAAVSFARPAAAPSVWDFGDDVEEPAAPLRLAGCALVAAAAADDDDDDAQQPLRPTPPRSRPLPLPVDARQ
jgi:hypothetical protein